MPEGITIRDIEPGDRHDMLRGLTDGRVSEETVYRRFHGPKPTLSAGELRYLTEVDQRDHIALVATPADRPDHLIGSARAVRISGARSEVAIIVADAWHGRGIGSALTAALLDRMRAAGLSEAVAVVHGQNAKVERLLARFGARRASSSELAISLA